MFTSFVKSLAQFVRACERKRSISSCAHAHTSRPREFRPFVQVGTRSEFITVTTPELFQNSCCAHWKRPIFTGHAYHLSNGFCAFVRADGGKTLDTLVALGLGGVEVQKCPRRDLGAQPTMHLGLSTTHYGAPRSADTVGSVTVAKFGCKLCSS